jgi:hypothetical protein
MEDKITLFKLLMLDRIQEVYPELHFKKVKVGGKVKDSHEDVIVVYADATIAFPVLCLYALSMENPRKPKRLYKKLEKYYDELSEIYFNKKKLHEP